MVYTKAILISLILVIMYSIDLSAGTKFAYKKPIYGKVNNAIKEKRYKVKPEAFVARPVPESTTISTTSTISSASATTTTTTTTPLPSSPELLEIEHNTSAAASAVDISNESKLIEETTTPLSIITTSIPSSIEQSSIEAAATAVLDMPYISSANENALLLEESSTYETSTLPIATVIAPPTEQPSVAVTLPKVMTPPPPAVLPLPPPSNQPVACTCGVFLSSQIHKGMTEQPLILNELDRMYPCNAIGRKQCQTKCLEAIVQHLPNSASIVCATLGNDCHKERAYLFIKNCQNQWWNTNLQAGREYCCKDGQPYRCPLI